MSDMMNWRNWADDVHKNISQKSKPKVRLSCTNCHHKTTKNQAKINNGYCFSCKHILKSYKSS